MNPSEDEAVKVVVRPVVVFVDKDVVDVLEEVETVDEVDVWEDVEEEDVVELVVVI